jgi:hypothetical protein
MELSFRILVFSFTEVEERYNNITSSNKVQMSGINPHYTFQPLRQNEI